MRPERAIGALATLEARVPARAVKRVTETPALAAAWAWDEARGTIVTGDATVTFVPRSGVVGADDVTCTCLLAPRCLHVYAVMAVLVEAGGAPAPVAAAVRPTHVVTEVERTVAIAAFVGLARLLKSGAEGAGALTRADLARVAYDAREAGLHRIGRALARVVGQLRLLEGRHPGFVLAELEAHLLDAFATAHVVGAPDLGGVDPAWVGEARRSFAPVGTLRLYGLLSEPVVGGAGSAGIVTWMADGAQVWSVADVRPRSEGQIPGLYDVAPPLTTLSHRQLAREGLYVHGATAAGDRLGAGAGVSAVRASGAGWDRPPFVGAFAEDLQAQLDRAVQAEVETLSGPRGNAPFVYTRGAVVGVARDALHIATPDGSLALVVGASLRTLPWRDNLGLLGRCPGLVLQVVGRPHPERPRTLVALAAGSDGFDLPAPWAGRVNLAFDRLTTAMLPSSLPSPRRIEAPPATEPSPLGALERRLGQVVLGGRAALPGTMRGTVARDAARLREALLPTGAALLESLADAAIAGDPEALAHRWLATAMYRRAATRVLSHGPPWLPSPPSFTDGGEG